MNAFKVPNSVFDLENDVKMLFYSKFMCELAIFKTPKNKIEDISRSR